MSQIATKRKIIEDNFSDSISNSLSKKPKLHTDLSSHTQSISASNPQEKMGTRVQTPNGKKEMPNGTKKLVINLKERPKLPENFEELTWNKLLKVIRAVYTNSQLMEYSLEELYQAAEDLCIHKKSAQLYSNLQRESEEQIKSELNKLVRQTSDPVSYLNLVNICWQDHCRHTVMIRSIFLYLDRTYVLQNSNILSIWDMGLQLFRTHIATQSEVQSKTVNSLIATITQERRGETVDRSLLKNLLRMLVSLQIYSTVFEAPFLDATSEFYAEESSSYLSFSESAEYLRHVENRLRSENERVLHYLDASTRRPLSSIVEKQLITQHVDIILSKGFGQLMDSDRIDDLKRMYVLLAKVNALDKMKVYFNKYIKEKGVNIVGKSNQTDAEKDKQMVSELLAFRSKLDGELERAFHSNEQFANSLKEAFESFINSRANKPAEMIAKFVDSLLRSGNKSGSEEELEHTLDRVMVLFRYIHGKDVFEAFYKKDLAKRLLLDKSASIDAEKSMISKLKAECGSSFTNKLEGMFKDIDVSKDIMGTFKQFLLSSKFAENGEVSGEIELNVHVLTAGYWPAYPPIELTLPLEFAKYQKIFSTFYLSKHNGRKLTWQNSLGHCELKANFPIAKKQLSVSLFQTVVLLLFNDGDKKSYKDIQQATGIEEGELKRTLQSLACGKVRVLIKEPKGKDVNDDDSFAFNAEFKQKLFKIKVNSIQLKETVEENQKTTQGVMQDRQYQIDAAIVRIMKARKQLNHTQLVSELYSQLKFPVKAADLKKRIESLIEREYLERDSENSQIYKYLA